MGRFRVSMQETRRKKVERPHPIWRGIGCFFIIIVPILSYAAATLAMPYFLNRGLIPRDFLFTPKTPDWLWAAPVVAQAYQFLFGRYAIAATLSLTLIFILGIGGGFSVLYAIIYRVFGPKRYGPLDAPPQRVKTKKYKR